MGAGELLRSNALHSEELTPEANGPNVGNLFETLA